VGDSNELCTAGDHATLTVHLSAILLVIFILCKLSWNLKPYTVSPPWPLQRGSVSRLFNITIRDVPTQIECTSAGIQDGCKWSQTQNGRCGRDAKPKILESAYLW